MTYSNMLPREYTEQAEEVALTDMWGQNAREKMNHSIGRFLIAAADQAFDQLVVEPLRAAGFGQ